MYSSDYVETLLFTAWYKKDKTVLAAHLPRRCVYRFLVIQLNTRIHKYHWDVLPLVPFSITLNLHLIERGRVKRIWNCSIADRMKQWSKALSKSNGQHENLIAFDSVVHYSLFPIRKFFVIFWAENTVGIFTLSFCQTWQLPANFNIRLLSRTSALSTNSGKSSRL